MAIHDPLKPTILATRIIPNVHPDYARQLGLHAEQRSIAIITCTMDDPLYVALDEATKMAAVQVVYGRSFYAGSGHGSGKLSGEVIGILAGPDPAEVRSGMNAAVRYCESEAWFYSASEDDGSAYFAHTVSRSGSYLSTMAGVPEGTALSYLISQPIEATYGIDAALKAAEVTMRLWFKPPSETNFGGALLSGSQSACVAACRAFADAVLQVAANPLHA